MPHLRIEYSTNIAGRFDPAAVLVAATDALVASGVFAPADAVKAPAEEKVVRLADPKEDGWHTLQHDNGQKKTVMKMTGREVTE